MAGRLALVVLAVVAVASWVDLVEPFATRAPEHAPQAHALVERLAFPRVMGSDGMRRALDDVEAELRAMPGVVTQRASGWTKSDSRWFDAPIFVYATALVARLPGSGVAGEGARLAFSAHLDSVAHAPGVGDDLAGVAGVVEALRHASRTRPKGDVAAIISAQEEGCVTCAAQLVASLPVSERVTSDVVIVLDESGNAPPISAFDALRDDVTGTHSNGLVAASSSAFGWTLVSDVVHLLGLGVGRTEMTDIATRVGPDREGARPVDRTPPVPALAVGAMRGQRVYHSSCDDLAHAHPALVDDVVQVARELVGLANEPPSSARADVLALRVPFAGTIALPRLLLLALALASFAVLVVVVVRRRAHVRSIMAGGGVAVVCAIVMGVASLFVPSADVATMARVGELQCAALLAAALGLVVVVRALIAARVDAHAFACGALGAAYVVGVLPALLATLTYSALPGFLTLACAAGLALVPLVAHKPHALLRAIAAVPLVVMTTQLALILAANWWSLSAGGTGAPFVGLTGALLAGAAVVSVIDVRRRRIVAVAGTALVVIGVLVAGLTPHVARTRIDETCPPPVSIDYFHDASADPSGHAGAAVLFTSDAQADLIESSSRKAFLDEAMTRPLEGAGVERADPLVALFKGNTSPYRVRDVALRVPPPRARLVRVEDRAQERVWLVHIEPAQEPGVLTLHEDDGPAWRSVSVGDAVALPHDNTPVRPLLLATPRAGVAVTFATALDVDTLHLRITEQGVMPEGLLPSMAGRVTPSSGLPQTARASPVTFVRTHERLTRIAPP